MFFFFFSDIDIANSGDTNPDEANGIKIFDVGPINNNAIRLLKPSELGTLQTTLVGLESKNLVMFSGIDENGEPVSVSQTVNFGKDHSIQNNDITIETQSKPKVKSI